MFLCDDIIIYLLKPDSKGKSYADLVIISSLEQHIKLAAKTAISSVKLIRQFWSNISSTVQFGVFETVISVLQIAFAFIRSCMERSALG